MNVTQEIQKNHIVYGASDYTAPGGLAASKSLNYAKGPTITNPDRATVSVIPYTFRYADSVGLFGAENYFVRVELDIISEVTKACFAEDGWQCAYIDYNYIDKDPNYNSANIEGKLGNTVNTYESANLLVDTLPGLPDAYLSIDVSNIKSNNRFTDDWLDVRLYTDKREEHPFETMYVRPRSFFYIGVHARNTKRLPYDLRCEVGMEYRTYESIEDKKLIMQGQ